VESQKKKIASLKTDPKSSERSSFFRKKPAHLYLNDGVSFAGELAFEATRPAVGEVVFNTGMTGYVESLTDPSYAGQILAFTYPLIGNYGVRLSQAESKKIQVNGVVVAGAAEHFSHAQADQSLLEWLKSQDIPMITGVDTRALTKHLRTRGTMLGAISTRPIDFAKLTPDFRAASVGEPEIFNAQHSKKIVLVDCGAKANILRSLLSLPLQVKLVPHDYDYTEEDYHGVLLSNGPGDPMDYKPTIAIAKKALKIDRPMFGICLGSQIMGLAAGGQTYKLHFGHRGHNQPCIDLGSGRCYITSQNHGYALDEKTLPDGWKVTFRNLNDDSVEGIEHRTKPFFSVQFHPEASPGPTDTNWLFERFAQLV
jgi:carbamoyl-phosphate synthase small subunit